MTEKKPSKKKGIYTVLMLLCIAVFLVALYKIIDIYMGYKEIDDFYNQANDDYVIQNDDGSISYVDLDRLVKENGDIKGWIYIEGTDISYPLLQGPDNDYYLYRTYKKEYLFAGSIFIDAANAPDLSDQHTIIYGHNMKNDSMFGTLGKFKQQDYRDQHRYIYILMPGQDWNKYEIFSAYTADIDDGTFRIFRENSEEYEKYISLATSKNMYTGIETPSSEEKIITLSTCTSDLDEQKRFVLQAILVGTVESRE